MNETEEGFKLAKGELVETQGEIGQVRDELEKVKDVQAQMEGKVRDIKQNWWNVLRPDVRGRMASLRNRGRKYAPSKRIVTR